MGSIGKEAKKKNQTERLESPEMLDEAEVGISEGLYEQVSLMAAEEDCTEGEVVGMALRSYLRHLSAQEPPESQPERRTDIWRREGQAT